MTFSAIAAQGPDNSLMFYWQTIGPNPWNPELVAGGTAFSAPSIAQDYQVDGINTLAIAAQGADNSLWLYLRTIGTTSWRAEQVAGPNKTFLAAPSLVQGANAWAIAASATDASLMFYWKTIDPQTTSWSPPEQVPGPHIFSAPSIAQAGNPLQPTPAG